MCQGTITIMSCGHALIHYRSYCHQAAVQQDRRPCPQERVRGPLQAIDDSCAACHPSFKISEINQRHDKFQNLKMAQMRQARSIQEVLALQRALEESQSARAKELRDAGRVMWKGVVFWGPPGANGCKQEECQLDLTYS
jgi:Cytochrome c552